MNRLRYVLVSCLLAMALSGTTAHAADVAVSPAIEPLSNFPVAMLHILTPDARQHHFKIWIADTEAHREQGLMFVKALPANTGMLFVFNRPRRVQMWMKNTLIPLDMVFIDANGVISNIVANTKPLSRDIIDSQQAALGVLELAGGSTVKLGIHIGALVKHPAFASVGGSR